jgi:hypothetical protein
MNITPSRCAELLTISLEALASRRSEMRRRDRNGIQGVLSLKFRALDIRGSGNQLMMNGEAEYLRQILVSSQSTFRPFSTMN